MIVVGVGASYAVTSCDLGILMNQTTESISPHDSSHRHDDSWFVESKWRCLSQGTVRTVDVVMIGILGQHQLQLPTSKMSIRSSSSRRTVPTHRSA
jgi:hypothetical protein